MIDLVLDIAASCPLNSEELLNIAGKFQSKKYPKKYTFLNYGSKEEYYYYIKSGLVVKGLYNFNGDLVVSGFNKEGEWLNYNFTDDYLNCSHNNYITVEKSIIFQIRKDDLKELIKTYPQIMLYFAKILERKLYKCELRIMNNLIFQADRQYMFFVNVYDDIANRLPLQYIASYLGIKPETLSRTRKKVEQKNFEKPFS